MRKVHSLKCIELRAEIHLADSLLIYYELASLYTRSTDYLIDFYWIISESNADCVSYTV